MKQFSSPSSLLAVCGCFFLTSLAALSHPGHYHPPDEVDEFDAFRADWLHLHGAWEISFALIALISAFLFYSQARLSIRIAAAIAFGTSLILIAAN